MLNNTTLQMDTPHTIAAARTQTPLCIKNKLNLCRVYRCTIYTLCFLLLLLPKVAFMLMLKVVTRSILVCFFFSLSRFSSFFCIGFIYKPRARNSVPYFSRSTSWGSLFSLHILFYTKRSFNRIVIVVESLASLVLLFMQCT